MNVPERLRRQLDTRVQKGNLRALSAPKPNLVDFSSNDYLGLARSEKLTQAIALEIGDQPAHGATGARLLSGNTAYAQELETQIASFHDAEAALLFTSGYAANTGFFSAVPQRGDTIFYDEASHASIKDGIRLSFADSFSFRHNDLEDLQAKLKRAKGDVYVAVEAIYSMDGDSAPLPELANFCQDHGLYLVVDEAHSNGLFGPKGEGLVSALGLQKMVFARIMTFGKALGCHGATIVGPSVLQQYLLNFSRPFIYTTALPMASLAAIKYAYLFLPELSAERAQVEKLSTYYSQLLLTDPVFDPFFKKQPQNSPIQAWHLPDPVALRHLSGALQEQGMDVRPVFSPTVPAGTERLRIVLHAFNTPEQILTLWQTLTLQTPKDISSLASAQT